MTEKASSFQSRNIFYKCHPFVPFIINLSADFSAALNFPFLAGQSENPEITLFYIVFWTVKILFKIKEKEVKNKKKQPNGFE